MTQAANKGGEGKRAASGGYQRSDGEDERK
jgi:hypothetical protein